MLTVTIIIPMSIISIITVIIVIITMFCHQSLLNPWYGVSGLVELVG